MKKIYHIVLILILSVFTEFTFSQDNALYLSQSMPGDMEPGIIYNVSVSMKNTGTTVWTPSNYFLRLVDIVDAITKTWPVNTVELRSPVNPGEMHTFYFRTRSPLKEGGYNVQWQMANGTTFFGEPTASVPVRVAGETGVLPDSITGNPPKASNNAQFLSISMPLDWNDGKLYEATMMIKNTGTTDWIPGAYKLRIYSKASDNNPESVTISYIDLPNIIYAGTEGAVTFLILAPGEDGVYNARAQMYNNGMLFGEPSHELIINVH